MQKIILGSRCCGLRSRFGIRFAHTSPSHRAALQQKIIYHHLSQKVSAIYTQLRYIHTVITPYICAAKRFAK